MYISIFFNADEVKVGTLSLKRIVYKYKIKRYPVYLLGLWNIPSMVPKLTSWAFFMY